MGIFNRRKAALTLAALGALWGATASGVAAQATATIRGTVVEAGSQRPLGSARVSVVGTEQNAVTNSAGQYTLSDVPAGTVALQASLLGYGDATQTVDVAAGQTASVDFALASQALTLDALVVTGTPGVTSQRTLGNSVTTVNVEQVVENTAVTNVIEVLQGRSPGVQIRPNSGTPGAAADIQIRGTSSFIGNQPVVYVDGIRYNIGSLGNFAPSGAGVTSYSAQETSSLLNLNPNDIESIEVIKGPAAATLYGAEAAGGVIQIITKKGTRGQQGTQWNVGYERGVNEWVVDIPTNYTTCTEARIADRTASGEPIWPGCQGVPAGTLLTGNPLRDDPLALREGDVQRLSLSARGGGENYSFYVSGDTDLDEGVFANSFNDRRSLRANFTVEPSDRFDFQVNTSYIRGHLRLPLGDETAQGLFLSAVRGTPGRLPPAGDPARAGYWSVNAAMANAYDNQTRSDRLTISGTSNYLPFDWFRNRLTVGLDLTSSLADLLSPPGSTDADYAGTPEGLAAQRVPRNRTYTIDYAGNLIWGVLPELESTTSFGTQVIARRYEILSGLGLGLGAPDVTLIQTALNPSASNNFSENNSVGYYVQEQLAWRNRVFVTGALRADDNSSFGENFDLIVYPKASLSWVLSEEPAVASFFDLVRADDFRFRTAWGQAGRAPDPYSAVQTYSVGRAALAPATAGGDVGLGSAVFTSAFGNEDLKPERGTEYEVGFDASFFENRASAEFTYYNKRMTDLIVPVGIPGSAGFPGNRLENLGETLNTGFELGLTGVPVQTSGFTWDTRLTLSTNDNELVSFGDDGSARRSLPSQAYGAFQFNAEGYPLAGYWGRLALRNPDGTPVLNATGVVQLDTATYIGPSAPTREIGFSNTFTLFRNFRIYSLLDYKGGHYLYNYKEDDRCRVRGNCQLVNDPSQADNPEIPVYRQVRASWIDRADFVKLRDLSLTYTLPTAWAGRFGANTANVTFAGHNLALWSDYSGLDPEVNTYGNRSFIRADIYALPMTRRLTASINASF